MANCEWFEIIDWDEETNEIYYAVCTRSSEHWKDGTCGPNCEHRVECAGGKVLLTAQNIELTQGDVDILDGSKSRLVRCNETEDVRVKALYKTWKSL